MPTVNIWWAHTIKPSKPVDIMAHAILIHPNGSFFTRVVGYNVGDYAKAWEN
jgi:hypothetical protein